MIHLISDLHLCDQQPHLMALFEHYMENIAPQSHQLFILGDFFEVWVGDDFISDSVTKVKTLLKSYTDSGKQLFIMHGNRDFLLGEDFCNAVNATLLADTYQLAHAGKKFLLMHGDQLCTDDHAYQNFRRMVRDETWQKDLLAKSLQERIAIAEHMRSESQSHTQTESSMAIMDVSQDAVDKIWLHEPMIIHGHTHRPAHHCSNECSRYVLSDWRDYGNYLMLTDKGDLACYNFWLDGKSEQIF